MSKFKLVTGNSRASLIMGTEILLFSTADLPDLLAEVSKALEEHQKLPCKCPLLRGYAVCGKPFVPGGYHNTKACANEMPDGTLCEHHEACHSTQSTDQEGK